MTSLSFHYHFIANLEQSGSRIRDAVTLIFSLIVAFYLTKSANRTKNLKHSCHNIALSEGTLFDKNADFLLKNADISKITKALVLKGMFSETTYVCLLTCQI